MFAHRRRVLWVASHPPFLDGHGVTVVDNLSTGKRENIPVGAIHEIDLARRLLKFLPTTSFDVVCHLAANRPARVG